MVVHSRRASGGFTLLELMV
ncbi:prepilin-type N-terminal cleavage/methylation domain-containing protein, partial [Pseudomonas sp. ATCC 13867]